MQGKRKLFEMKAESLIVEDTDTEVGLINVNGHHSKRYRIISSKLLPVLFFALGILSFVPLFLDIDHTKLQRGMITFYHRSASSHRSRRYHTPSYHVAKKDEANANGKRRIETSSSIKRYHKPRIAYINSKTSQEPRRQPSAFLPDYELLEPRADSKRQQPRDENDECVPMKKWQAAYYPNCNDIHSLDMTQHESQPSKMELYGTNGYWRYAWKKGNNHFNNTNICDETVILKTLKFQHNFDASTYEHSRIDAMAMERLTSSPHVINIFGSCANSLVTEFADGHRVGTLADSKKKTPLSRLKIARDIATGLADVHSIDGNDQQATLVHYDINLANIVTVGGTLKLNDFNIGVLLKKNTTSGGTCGYPATQNFSQWRSPEEANGSKHLTEKVDVYSLGHIFFRLICLHEPWHKLEPSYEVGDGINTEYIKDKVKNGPTIPNEIMKTDDAEVRIIREAMLFCYTVDPKQRPSARSIANFLEKGLAELSKYERLPGRNHYGSFRIKPPKRGGRKG